MPDTKKYKILRYADSIVRVFRKFPPSLHIALTDHCWNKCPTCGHHKRRRKDVLNWPQLENLLKYAAFYDLETVCFTGGAPLRYQDINKAMELCLTLGVDYGVVTSGYCPPWVNQRLLAGARWVRCSIDAVDQKQYATVRGGGITWDQVCGSLQKLFMAGANLQVFTTISSHNELALNDLYKWLFGHKEMFSELRARPAYKHTDETSKPNDITRISIVLGYWAKKFSDADIITNFTASQFDPLPIQRCMAVKYQLFIGADGYVYPCCIAAGDTEASNRVKPFGHIKYVPQGAGQPNKPWQQCLDNIDAWTWASSTKLPRICLGECAPRFNEINTMWDTELLKEKNFF